jgi:hypothetical protein
MTESTLQTKRLHPSLASSSDLLKNLVGVVFLTAKHAKCAKKTLKNFALLAFLASCRRTWSAVHFSPQRREDRQENSQKLCALGDFAVQMSILYVEAFE